MAGVFDDAQLDDANAHLRSSSDHARSLPSTLSTSSKTKRAGKLDDSGSVSTTPVQSPAGDRIVFPWHHNPHNFVRAPVSEGDTTSTAHHLFASCCRETSPTAIVQSVAPSCVVVWSFSSTETHSKIFAMSPCINSLRILSISTPSHSLYIECVVTKAPTGVSFSSLAVAGSRVGRSRRCPSG